jgi:hypothetical protein
MVATAATELPYLWQQDVEQGLRNSRGEGLNKGQFEILAMGDKLRLERE